MVEGAPIPPPPVLDVKNLSGGYDDTLVLNGVTLAIGRGESLALLGRNGMGKTTLVRMILGFLLPRTGSVLLFGRDATGRAPNLLVRDGVAYAPQEKAIFQDLSVRDNLRLAAAGDRAFRDALPRAFELFPLFERRLVQKAGTLSGGEQKMLMVARALMVRPRLLLIDEISEGLQPSVIAQIATVLRRERDAGTAMLLVEQNVAFALAIADRWAVLKRGAIDDQGMTTLGAASRIAEHFTM
jgi:ABC-type branched-subunit amino acid transport system ATPase component